MVGIHDQKLQIFQQLLGIRWTEIEIWQLGYKLCLACPASLAFLKLPSKVESGTHHSGSLPWITWVSQSSALG